MKESRWRRVTGVRLIAEERAEQQDEHGYRTYHDDDHKRGELVAAALCYLRQTVKSRDKPPGSWPWEDDAWKPCPGDRIRELVKAGALIAAEVDRLLRIEQRQKNDRAG